MSKQKKVMRCECCAKEFYPWTASRSKFCSIQCQHDYALKERIHDWLSGKTTFSNRVLRRMLAEHCGYSCSVCGISDWQGKSITLEVEHVDGNSDNSAVENVCLICPNCHSQTPTYKGANKGKGRHYRRTRYAEGKSY